MALNANTQYFFCASKYMGGLIIQLLALTFVHLHNNQSINQFALSCLTDGSEFPEVCEVDQEIQENHSCPSGDALKSQWESRVQPCHRSHTGHCWLAIEVLYPLLVPFNT